MKQIIFFTILSLFFSSCWNEKNATVINTGAQIVLNFEDQLSTSLFSDKFFEHIGMIPLETTDKCLVGSRPEILADVNHFFIKELQQQVILRFDKIGKFINRIGQRGGGPGEYQGDIKDFEIDITSNIIEVLTQSGQLLRYSYEGNFISKQNFGINVQSFIKSGPTYWLNLGVSKLFSDGRILKVSENGTVIEKFLPLKTDWFGFEDLNFTRSDDIISFKEAFNHSVYRITDSGPVETTVINFGKYAIPKNVYDQNQISVFEELNKKGWAIIYRYLENKQFVYIFSIVQQNEEVIGFYHWLVNKKTGNSVLQKLLPDDFLFEMMEEAKILTSDNELVFIANASMLKKCTDPFFNSATNIRNSLTEESNPVIISLKIKDF